MVTVKDLAKGNIISVNIGTPVAKAAQVMAEQNIGSPFVEHNDQIVGILTEPDIVRKIVGKEIGPTFAPVGTVMSRPIIGIEETRPITEAADLMNQHHTRHLAVFQRGAIVGVLSVRDLLHPVSIDEF